MAMHLRGCICQLRRMTTLSQLLCRGLVATCKITCWLRSSIKSSKWTPIIKTCASLRIVLLFATYWRLRWVISLKSNLAINRGISSTITAITQRPYRNKSQSTIHLSIRSLQTLRLRRCRSNKSEPKTSTLWVMQFLILQQSQAKNTQSKFSLRNSESNKD